MTDAEAADMRATNDAYVRTSETSDVTTTTKTATATRKSGTAGRRYSDHYDRGDCENFSVESEFSLPGSFFFGVEPKLGHERRNFQY